MANSKYCRVCRVGVFRRHEGFMDQRQLLELALEALQSQRTEIERAIEEIREFQGGNKRAVTRNPEVTSLLAASRKSRTVAQRKTLSLKMKQIWALKKAKAAKSAIKPKARTMTAKRKKALSIKMREIWKKRKEAAAAKKAK